MKLLLLAVLLFGCDIQPAANCDTCRDELEVLGETLEQANDNTYRAIKLGYGWEDMYRECRIELEKK